MSRCYIRRGGEDILIAPHRLVPIKNGDMVIKVSSGGGGVGSPFMRDPKMVLKDVVNELVTIDGARRDYGVAIDPDTLSIDLAATSALRAEVS